MRGLQRSQAIVFGLMLVVRLSGDVVFQPTFGHPLIHTDRIVFTTVDGKSLIGIDKDGTQKWKIRFPGRVNVNRWDENTLLVQSGQQVFQIDVRQGAQSKLITMPKYQYLGADALDHSFFMAIDSRFDHYRVQILDPTSHAPIWESSAIENILHLTPDLVVAVTAERVIERHGYSLRNGTIQAYSRSDGHVRWSVALTDRNLVASAASDHFLVIVERLRVYEGDAGSNQLVILNPDTGEVLSRQRGEFDDLVASGDSLMVLEGTFGGPGSSRLYSCILPECARSPGILLQAKEMLRFQSYRDYVLTWGIYDAACFSGATGKRLWQKGQIDWSEPFGNQMVAADFSPRKSMARIVSIDLQTGTESVLFEQRVTKKDRSSFRLF